MKVIIQNALLSFCDLFEAKTIGDSKEPKFSGTFVCLNGDEDFNPNGYKTQLKVTNSEGKKVAVPYAKMQEICEKVLKEKFNGKVPVKHVNWAFNKADGSTTRDAFVDKEGEYYSGVTKDSYYISATKQEKLVKDGKLVVVDQHKRTIEANSGLIFSGCIVNAVIDVYAFPAKNGSKDGVTASLEGVQLKHKGEPMGFTQTDAADDFEEEEITEDEVGDLL